MVSDDTEHACMVAQALIASGFDAERFPSQLAIRLRRWLLCVPAGVGMATLKACLKLCFRFSPNRSGVFSAGNGPAMRAPILGAAIENLDLLREMVRASTRITHTDPKAEQGAWAIALAARSAAQCRDDESFPNARQYVEDVRRTLTTESSDELLGLLESVANSLDRNESTLQFADSLGLQRGVSGYMYHTVPVVLHAWLNHPRDLTAAIEAVIECGGDADTTAAIVGGIVGCTVGKSGIDQHLLETLCEWPRSVNWMEQLAEVLTEVASTGTPQTPPHLPVWGVLPRNLIFAVIVLTHGFRRLAPPY